MTSLFIDKSYRIMHESAYVHGRILCTKNGALDIVYDAYPSVSLNELYIDLSLHHVNSSDLVLTDHLILALVKIYYCFILY
jgi:hypothetical protein